MTRFSAAGSKMTPETITKVNLLMYGVVSLDIVITPALGETFFYLIGQKHM